MNNEQNNIPDTECRGEQCSPAVEHPTGQEPITLDGRQFLRAILGAYRSLLPVYLRAWLVW